MDAVTPETAAPAADASEAEAAPDPADARTAFAGMALVMLDAALADLVPGDAGTLTLEWTPEGAKVVVTGGAEPVERAMTTDEIAAALQAADDADAED